MHCVLWNCLDKDGQDACRITGDAAGWTIEGTAVFRERAQVASLGYRLHCDPHWVSARATVKGWVGARSIDLHIASEAGGRWSINGRVDQALTGLLDIDLGFTPASNTNALQRLNLQDGATASSVAVWLDTEDWHVKALHQTYTRVHRNAYDYASPRHGLRATLAVDDSGVVTVYPGLWKALVSAPMPADGACFQRSACP